MSSNCLHFIVWLDSNANDSISSFRSKLTANHNQCVKTFTEVNPCVTFIEKNTDQNIFFILSGSFGRRVVPLVYNYDHVHKIFLFCGSMKIHTDWAMDYIDKILLFDHEDDLLQRLFKEIEQYLRQEAQLYLQQADICKDRAKTYNQGSCG